MQCARTHMYACVASSSKGAFVCGGALDSNWSLQEKGKLGDGPAQGARLGPHMNLSH